MILYYTTKIYDSQSCFYNRQKKPLGFITERLVLFFTFEYSYCFAKKSVVWIDLLLRYTFFGWVKSWVNTICQAKVMEAEWQAPPYEVYFVFYKFFCFFCFFSVLRHTSFTPEQNNATPPPTHMDNTTSVIVFRSFRLFEVYVVSVG